MSADIAAATPGRIADVDVVVVGAGFAGLYLLHRLRKARLLRAGCSRPADDVGGTWYWNRYPGARCDIQTIDYSYSWDPELEDEWQWSEKYATQPEILRYLQHVADKHDLRRDIQFSTRVERRTWDDDASLWRMRTDRRRRRSPCRFYVMATGCLSVPEDARHRGRRPLRRRGVLHEPLAARGRRLHRQAGRRDRHRVVRHPVDPDHRRSRPPQLTVFQRTPNFSMPAQQRPGPGREASARSHADRAAYRDAAQLVAGRRADARSARPARSQVSEEERLARVRGGLGSRRAVRRSSARSPTC